MVLVRLSPGGPFEVVDTSGPRVGHVKVAIIATFKKRFAGLDPDELQLVKLDGSCRTLLDPELTLSAADVHDGARLEVQRVASAFKGTRGERVQSSSVVYCTPFDRPPTL